MLLLSFILTLGPIIYIVTITVQVLKHVTSFTNKVCTRRNTSVHRFTYEHKQRTDSGVIGRGGCTRDAPDILLLSIFCYFYLTTIGDYLHRHHSTTVQAVLITYVTVNHKQSIIRRNMSFIIHFYTIPQTYEQCR